MDNILALDQATRISGFAIFQDNKLIKYGKIISPNKPLGQRFVYIKNKILSYIQEYNITKIVFEDIQLQNINNPKTFKTLAQLQGMIMTLLEEQNIPYEIIGSVTWKSGLKIKGKRREEQKKNAQLYVLNNYNITATQDEADAICIGTHYIQNTPLDWSK